jgi:hypothetical protein
MNHLKLFESFVELIPDENEFDEKMSVSFHFFHYTLYPADRVYEDVYFPSLLSVLVHSSSIDRFKKYY